MAEEWDEKLLKEVDNKLGLFIEHMNGQFERVLEAVESSTSKIPKISEQIEKLEHDITWVRLHTSGLNGDLKLVKIRTEKIQDNLNAIDAELKTFKNHEERITTLEAA